MVRPEGLSNRNVSTQSGSSVTYLEVILRERNRPEHSPLLQSLSFTIDWVFCPSEVGKVLIDLQFSVLDP